MLISKIKIVSFTKILLLNIISGVVRGRASNGAPYLSFGCLN